MLKTAKIVLWASLWHIAANSIRHTNEIRFIYY